MNKFPILGSEPKEYIPLNIIKLHEKQVIINHMQTLERLAERGGLSWNEILFVLKDKDYNRGEQVSEAAAKTKVLEIIKKPNIRGALMMGKNLQQLIDYLEAVKMEIGRDTEVRVDGCVIEDFEDYIDVDHVQDYVDFVTPSRVRE